MVRSGRPGIYHCLVVYGPGYDSRTGLPLLGPRAAKVCTLHDLGVHGILLDHRLPMVLLGLLAGFQLNCYKWVYWELGPFRPHGHPGDAFARIATHS